MRSAEMANMAPISTSSVAGPSATTDSDILMDLPVQGLPRYLPVAQTALYIHTQTLNTTPSILRVMMRELLATTTVLCTFTTVRPHSGNVRTRKLNRALLFLLVGRVRTCLGLCLIHFQLTRDV